MLSLPVVSEVFGVDNAWLAGENAVSFAAAAGPKTPAEADVVSLAVAAVGKNPAEGVTEVPARDEAADCCGVGCLGSRVASAPWVVVCPCDGHVGVGGDIFTLGT